MSQKHQKHANDEQKTDDSDWKAVAVGATGGFAIGGPVGAGAGAAIGKWLSSVEDDDSLHDRTLATAAENVCDHASDTGSLYIAHVNPDDVGRDLENENPQGIVPQIEGDPDILYVDVPGERAQLVAEVETRAGLFDQTDHTLDQLERYRAQGYKRMLVMPEGEVETAREWVEDHDDRIGGPLHICSAQNIAAHF